MSDSYVILYASCIPVRGAKNSIICDLQRQSYVQIPNGLYEILVQHKSKTVSEVKAFYKHEYDSIIDNYFQVLIQNEFAFITDTPECFPDIDLTWDQPFEISNAILDFNESSSFDVQSVLQQLSDLQCKFIQFRFYHQIPITRIEFVLNYLQEIQSNSIGVEFLLPYSENSTKKDFLQLFKKHKRLNAITVFSAPVKKHIIQADVSKHLIYTSVRIPSEQSCGVINKGMFSLHLKTFTESQQHNTCLNGKISIDKEGFIRNCPSMPASFGNIDTTTLQEALLQIEFKKYWNLNKDKIEICKDCEFRYICTDCRAYTQESNNDRSKPLKCGYDPYTGEWQDWKASDLVTQKN